MSKVEFTPTDTELASGLHSIIMSLRRSLTERVVQERYYQSKLARDKIVGKTDMMIDLGQIQKEKETMLEYLNYLIPWSEELEKKLEKESEKDAEL